MAKRVLDLIAAMCFNREGTGSLFSADSLSLLFCMLKHTRQKFRSHFKAEKCTYLEFAREEENLFDHWCTSVKVTTKEQLRELIILEEFKSCVPNAVAMHLNEHKGSKMSNAALMAEEFVLTHQLSISHLNDLNRSKLSVTVKYKKVVAH